MKNYRNVSQSFWTDSKVDDDFTPEEKYIHRMQDVHKVIRYDQETKEVLIVNWHKYNWTKSEKLLRAVL